MKRIYYLLFAMVLMFLIKTPGFGQAATYALPEFGGTAVFGEVKQLGGAYLPVKTVTIETDNPSSFLSLKWSKIRNH